MRYRYYATSPTFERGYKIGYIKAATARRAKERVYREVFLQTVNKRDIIITVPDECIYCGGNMIADDMCDNTDCRHGRNTNEGGTGW